jgi:hypothetical protein
MKTRKTVTITLSNGSQLEMLPDYGLITTVSDGGKVLRSRQNNR